MTIELLAPFLIGLFGSLHCLGMCGPLVMAYSVHIKSPEPRAVGLGPTPWGKGFFHHLAYHFGRLMTYGILGALAAGLVNIVGFNLYLPVRGGVILTGGVLITLLGMVFLQGDPPAGSIGPIFPDPSFPVEPSSSFPVSISRFNFQDGPGAGQRAPALLPFLFHAHQGGHHGKYGGRIYDHGGFWLGHRTHSFRPGNFRFPVHPADETYRGTAGRSFRHGDGTDTDLPGSEAPGLS